MNILSVEDDMVSRVYLEHGLKDMLEDCAITSVKSGEEAIEALEQKDFQVVVTDLVMPGIGGLDVLRHVKQVSPRTEVIVLTGNASVDTAVEAMRLGARDYMEKPANLPLLKQKLDNIFDYQRRTAEAEDFRLAKEAFENQANHDVRLMEMLLQKYRDAVEEALALAAGAPAGVEKQTLEEVVRILKRSGEDA